MKAVPAPLHELTQTLSSSYLSYQNHKNKKTLDRITGLCKDILNQNPSQEDLKPLTPLLVSLKEIKHTPLTKVVNHLERLIPTEVCLPPSGIQNQGNDCFLIALHQLLQVPFLKQSIVEGLPEPLRGCFLNTQVDSGLLREVILQYTSITNKDTNLLQPYAQADPSEVLSALLDVLADSPEASQKENGSMPTPLPTVHPPCQKKPSSLPSPSFPIRVLHFFTNCLKNFCNWIYSFFSSCDEPLPTIIPPPAPVKPPASSTPPAPPPKNAISPPAAQKLPKLNIPLCSSLDFTPYKNVPKTYRHHLEFGGETNQSIKDEAYPFLSIEMDSKNTSLNSLLTNFFTKEPVEDKCFASYKAKQTKRLALRSSPEYLLMHFKRFSFDRHYGLETKIQTPLQGLESSITLSPSFFLQPLKQSPSYELKAFICHIGGSPSRGHYTAYRKEDDGRWYYFNDAHCTQISEDKALEACKTSYMVFYLKK
ncbi:MAG: hypothetical protein FJZ63_01350 [Chlamydiae bacterium]|nr:hypothetical protein [Chlamydiota bacterium]